MAITFLQAFPQDTWSSAKNKRSICRGSNKVIFLGFTDYTGPLDRVKIAWSTDDGSNWTIQEVPGQGVGTDNRDIVLATCSDNSLVAVWRDGTQIVYCRRLANGAWNMPTIVAVPACTHPGVAIDSIDTAHIVWKEELPGVKDDIRYNTVSLAGALGFEINVTNLIVQRQVSPMIEVCRNNIAHIVWQGTGWGLNPGQYNIEYNRVTAGVLGIQVPITDKNIRQDDPELATDSLGFVHIAYHERAGLGTQGMYYTNNSAGAFAPPAQVTTDGGDAGFSIVLDAEDNRYIFANIPTVLPVPRTLKIISNKGSGWVTNPIITMPLAQSNDVYGMHSWYPRSGGVSPNILSDNWLAYTYWPYAVWFAYIMFPSPLSPPVPPPAPLNVLTLCATEVR